ncbi:MAG: hypothetical protein H0V89_02440 [Deltaproteobacteria bacterium]|nr:hypothetical protein [Deltaproteobacteria bacterium]
MLTIWLLTAPARADWPVGDEIPSGITADVTPEGLDAIGGLLPAALPSEVAIPEVHEYDEGGCIFGLCAYEYDLDVTNGTAYIAFDSLDIEPATGVLNLTVRVEPSVNSAADPMRLDVDATGLEIIDISESCDVWVEPILIELEATIALALVNGTVEATVPPLDWSWDLQDDDIVLDNCFVADVFDVLGFFGVTPASLIGPTVENEIDDLVAGLAPTIEAALEEAFASVSVVEGEVDLLGAPLVYSLEPDELTIVPDGVRIGFGTTFTTEPHPCVAQYGITESLATTGMAPPIGSWPDSIPYTPHMAINADDDMINQALFAVWQSGILCQTIDSASAADLGLPIAIDAGLLDLLAPDVYTAIVAEDGPLIIGVAPRLPPTASPQGDHDVNVAMRELGVDFLGEVDGRIVRLVGVDLEVDAGADLTFDDTTGLLAIAVALEDDAIDATVGFNELAPDASASIASSFTNLFNTLVGPVLTGALGDLTFPMPAFLGHGITALDVAPTGNLDLDASGGQGDHLGVYGTLGPVTYVATGCGCTEDPYASEGTSCDTSTSRGTSFLGLLTLAAVARRRKVAGR